MPSVEPASLAGRRLVVVGASAGIGRAAAVGAVRAGADVVVAARRREVLDEVVAEAGGGEVAVVDVADAASRAAWAEAVRAGPPVDLVAVTVGMAALRRLSATDDEAWSTTLATNLVGVARLLEEVRPALTPTGIMSVMSSETVRRPREGLVPYAASKAGLEAVLAGLRMEAPGLRVSCVVVGGTYPTEFGAAFTPDELGPAMEGWERHGTMQHELMAPDDVAAVLVDLWATALVHPGVNVDEVILRSPSPVLGVDPHR